MSMAAQKARVGGVLCGAVCGSVVTQQGFEMRNETCGMRGVRGGIQRAAGGEFSRRRAARKAASSGLCSDADMSVQPC